MQSSKQSISPIGKTQPKNQQESLIKTSEDDQITLVIEEIPHDIITTEAEDFDPIEVGANIEIIINVIIMVTSTAVIIITPIGTTMTITKVMAIISKTRITRIIITNSQIISEVTKILEEMVDEVEDPNKL